MAFALPIAMALDALLGEPRWLWSRVPHPAVWMGRLIGWLDKRLNTGPGQRAKGTLTLGVILCIAILIGMALSDFGGVVECLSVAILIAQKSLIDHVRAVADGLRLSKAEGRRAVSMIVSRDTGDMDGSSICRSGIESLAENFSDGVIAPIFWYLIAGLPGLCLLYTSDAADD